MRKTGWDKYLEGHYLEELAPLVDLPRPNKPILKQFSASIDRTIEAARESILTQKINIFDQTSINMFNDHQTKAGHPLYIKLQSGTYASYKTVWKKLLYFIYRLHHSQSTGTAVNLPYQLTYPQRVAFDRSIQRAHEITPPATSDPAENNYQRSSRLDTILLQFSIALLDYQLRGSIYKSFLVGFLAILGIDPENVCSP